MTFREGSVRVVPPSALVSSHIRAPRHLHRLVCECLSATKGERGRGRIDSIARSQKGTSASGQGGPPQGPQELRLAAFLPL